MDFDNIEPINPNYMTYGFWYNKLKDDYTILRLVPIHLRDKRMVMLSLKKNGYYLKYVPTAIKTPELCLKALKNNKGCIPFIPKHFYVMDSKSGLGRFKVEVIRAIKFIDIPKEIIFIFEGVAGNYEKTMKNIDKKSISVYENKMDYKTAVNELLEKLSL
jgi:hypothetical protein